MLEWDQAEPVSSQKPFVHRQNSNLRTHQTKASNSNSDAPLPDSSPEAPTTLDEDSTGRAAAEEEEEEEELLHASHAK